MDEGVDTHNLHLTTPSSDMHTHYFFASTRNFLTQDEAFNTSVHGMVENSFVTEDKWMLEAQQKCMGSCDLLAMKPVLLPVDAGAMRARRLLQKMIGAEQPQAAQVDLF